MLIINFRSSHKRLVVLYDEDSKSLLNAANILKDSKKIIYVLMVEAFFNEVYLLTENFY